MVNAYNRIGIPILLGFAPYLNNLNDLHAVVICGHGINNSESLSRNKGCSPFKSNNSRIGIKWESEKVNRFYVHDDQWGPFARIIPEGKNEIDTAWSFHLKSENKGTPIMVIVPVFPKVRIPYQDIIVVTCYLICTSA